jgi:hypothetical protein
MILNRIATVIGSIAQTLKFMLCAHNPFKELSVSTLHSPLFLSETAR